MTNRHGAQDSRSRPAAERGAGDLVAAVHVAAVLGLSTLALVACATEPDGYQSVRGPGGDRTDVLDPTRAFPVFVRDLTGEFSVDPGLLGSAAGGVGVGGSAGTRTRVLVEQANNQTQRLRQIQVAALEAFNRSQLESDPAERERGRRNAERMQREILAMVDRLEARNAAIEALKSVAGNETAQTALVNAAFGEVRAIDEEIEAIEPLVAESIRREADDALASARLAIGDVDPRVLSGSLKALYDGALELQSMAAAREAAGDSAAAATLRSRVSADLDRLLAQLDEREHLLQELASWKASFGARDASGGRIFSRETESLVAEIESLVNAGDFRGAERKQQQLWTSIVPAAPASPGLPVMGQDQQLQMARDTLASYRLTLDNLRREARSRGKRLDARLVGQYEQVLADTQAMIDAGNAIGAAQATLPLLTLTNQIRASMN